MCRRSLASQADVEFSLSNIVEIPGEAPKMDYNQVYEDQQKINLVAALRPHDTTEGSN